MLATNEGVPLALQWCSGAGAVVMYAMVLWSNQKRRVVAPCKGRPLQISVGQGPTDWPRTFDHPLFPIISTASGYRRTCGFPTKLDPTSSVSELHSTRWRPNRDRWEWRSSVIEPVRPHVCHLLRLHLSLCCPTCQAVGNTATSCDSGTASCRPTPQPSSAVV